MMLNVGRLLYARGSNSLNRCTVSIVYLLWIVLFLYHWCGRPLRQSHISVIQVLRSRMKSNIM
jgi:hypothetical protein